MNARRKFLAACEQELGDAHVGLQMAETEARDYPSDQADRRLRAAGRRLVRARKALEGTE